MWDFKHLQWETNAEGSGKFQIQAIEILKIGRNYFLFGLLFFSALLDTTSAQMVNIKALYVQNGILKLDATIDSLFSQRTLDAIESGMTTSIVMRFRLKSDNTSRILDQTINLRLEHDIWEGYYRIIRQTSSPDTFQTTNFKEAEYFSTKLSNFSLGPISNSNLHYVILSQIEVNPISYEQHQRTRKWLNILEEGSLLEFFISLDRPFDRIHWLEIKRFNLNTLTSRGLEKKP